MIGIFNNRDLLAIADQWYKDLYQFFFLQQTRYELRGTSSRRMSPCCTRFDKMVGMLKNGKYRVVNRKLKRGVKGWLYFFKVNFKKIVLADESALRFYASTRFAMTDEQMNILKDFFVNYYKDFSSDYAYKYFERLNVRTCPYCNRNYTFTIDKNGIKTRPEYEHFYDKSDYPLLALSFYNLVPSCHDCNHIKGTKSIKINPYFNRFETKFVLYSSSDSNSSLTSHKLNAGEIYSLNQQNKYCLKFDKPTGDENENIKQLGLEELYNEHLDYVEEIVNKSMFYNSVYNNNLIDAFQGIVNSPQELYNLIWNQYLDLSEQEKRPLSKLTKDILDQLKIRR